MTASQPAAFRRPSDTGAETSYAADLEAMCRFVADLVAVAPVAPHRVQLRAGAASMEVEWPRVAADRGGGAPPADVPSGAETTSGSHEVCAPLVGTFHRSPEPGAPPFVEVGARVSAGQQVGIVEAMKLMNAVEADVDGCVCEVLVQDGEGVEYGQVLLRVVPLDQS